METAGRAVDRLSHSARTIRFPGLVLTVGTHAAGSMLARHAHDDPTLCYVLRGRFTEYARGLAADCGAETLKITPAGEPHWNRFGPAETRGLRLDVDRARFADTPSIFRMLDERLQIRGGPAGTLVRRIVGELESEDDAARLVAEGLLLELLAEISRDSEARPELRPPRWLHEADALVHETFALRFSLSDVAASVGVHPATLARAYRRTFRCSVGEKVRRLRVEHAARELVETSEPLTEIALRAGFYDQSHFTNVFRRYLGVTPARYRAQWV